MGFFEDIPDDTCMADFFRGLTYGWKHNDPEIKKKIEIVAEVAEVPCDVCHRPTSEKSQTQTWNYELLDRLGRTAENNEG